jgi:Protein of unknown function (DUF2948)
MNKNLRLKAESLEDLQIISAMLQDAAVKPVDIAYLPGPRRFALVTNRYRWEKEEASLVRGRGNRRVRSALRFENVLAASFQKIDLKADEDVLELLAIEPTQDQNGDLFLTLQFADCANIRLKTECLEVYLEDMSKDWHTMVKPDHSEQSPATTPGDGKDAGFFDD